MSYSTHIKLKPVAPYNFELNARIFTGGHPQISGYDNGKFWQVINANDILNLIIVKSSGTVDEPELSITLKSDKKITDEDLKLDENIIISMFNLDFDLKEFYEYMKNNGVISKLIRQLRGLDSRTNPTVFESLISSIIEQQISLRASQSIERHMIKDCGNKLHLDGEVYYAFPTPQTLSKLTKEKLRESGLSLRKSKYIINISKLIVDRKLDLDHLKEYNDVIKIIDELSQLRGVSGQLILQC
jgi:DNA-3-methyladenine glycosylase II